MSKKKKRAAKVSPKGAMKKKRNAKGKSRNLWIRIFFILIIILAFLILVLKPDSFQNRPEKVNKISEPVFNHEGTLTFYNAEDSTAIVTIDIEIADNDQERSRGLMYRKSMQDDQGMLFVMEREQPQSFWMRNTYISLDIVFLDKDLRIVTIQRNTEPQSLTSIPSFKPAKYVVEIVAGFCRQHGISEGDIVKYKRLPPEV
ncbi:MAG: DUF192 domain-containing protein [Bacteroidales bacterium]|nr:DUF192 domain-containing protein [Bacteroidales bacterium]